MQLGPLLGIGRADQLLRRLCFDVLDDIRRYRHLDGNDVLGETDDPELRASGYTFETLAVIQRDRVCHTICSDGMTRALSKRNFDTRSAIVFDEHIPQCAVGIDVFGIDDCTAAESAELTWRNRRKTASPRSRASEVECLCCRVRRER